MADDAAGKAKHVKGKIQEAAGDLLGDRSLEREGELSQMEGRAEQDEARALRDAREANERKNAAKMNKDF